MIRRILALATTCLLCAAAPSRAKDANESLPIGFSADSRYFAYEQYLVDGAAAAAFADIEIIDTTTGAHVEGSPFHAESLEEDASIVKVRGDAAAKAAPALAKLGIAQPPVLLAATPVYEAVADRQTVIFDRWLSENTGSTIVDSPASHEVRYELKIEHRDRPEIPPGCEADMGPYQTLHITVWPRAASGGTTVHSEDVIPPGRGCPVAYDIDKIIAPMADDAHPDLLVALIGIYEPGWEGADRRIIALPFSLR